jgi:predicted TIM-barrel fold metal-dependent hydrolase
MSDDTMKPDEDVLFERWLEERIADHTGLLCESSKDQAVESAQRRTFETVLAYVRRYPRRPTATISVDPRVADVVSAATALRELDSGSGKTLKTWHAALVRLYNALDALPTLEACRERATPTVTERRIRAETIKECALIADSLVTPCGDGSASVEQEAAAETAHEIARLIRALGQKIRNST